MKNFTIIHIRDTEQNKAMIAKFDKWLKTNKIMYNGIIHKEWGIITCNCDDNCTHDHAYSHYVQRYEFNKEVLNEKEKKILEQFLKKHYCKGLYISD